MRTWTPGSPTSNSPRSEPRSGRLAGCVLRAGTLTAAQRDQMYGLLAQCFAGTTRERFERDLAEKDWAILLADETTGQVQGFSTLMRLEAAPGGQRVVAFFSGDTIIHPAYWGQQELPRLWAQHAMALSRQEEGARVFWLLISSGYKTYRFLPVFFREFYPRFDRPTPPEIQEIMDGLARQKFPAEYDPVQGVIRFAEPTPLRAGVAELSGRRLRDPHVAFFVERNPGHADGDELVCLCELAPENLTAAGRRMLGAPGRR